MDERESFIRAIAASPDDDAQRLVFSDWLEEHGEAERDEFVRSQTLMSQLSPFDPQYHQLEQRSDRLMDQFGIAWRAELPKLPNGVEWGNWGRGFIETLVVRDSSFLPSVSDDLLQPEPFRRLEIHRSGHTLHSLPALQRVRRLMVVGGYIRGEAETLDVWRRWVQTPEFSSLRSLELAGMDLPEDRFSVLLNECSWTQLESLHIASTNLPVDAMKFIATPEQVETLRSLQLPDYLLSSDDLRYFQAFRYSEVLRDLGLYRSGWDRAGSDLLLRCLTSCELERLAIGGHFGLESFFESVRDHDPLSTVRNLELRVGEANTHNITNLLTSLEQSRFLNHLESFSIWMTTFDLAEVFRLLSTVPKSGMRSVLLHRYQGGTIPHIETNVRALTLQPIFKELQSLSLQYPGLQDNGFRALIEAPLNHLRSLTLIDPSVSEKALGQLANSIYLPSLYRLSLPTRTITRELADRLRERFVNRLECRVYTPQGATP